MSRRSLWPREHGAYFQLAIPLVAALAMRVPRIAAITWSLAACLAFLAHEPLVVLLGHRGPRMRGSAAPRARVALAVLAGGAALLGAIALALGPSAMILAAACSLAPAAAVTALAWRHDEHTLIGELIAAIALTGAAAPALVASGASPTAALAIWLGWAIGFGASVIAVHRVMARHRRTASPIDVALAVGLTALAVASIATATRWPTSRIAAPLVSLAAVLVIAPPSASRLRAVGIAIAAAAVVACLLAVLTR